jgi:hypothetical protein
MRCGWLLRPCSLEVALDHHRCDVLAPAGRERSRRRRRGTVAGARFGWKLEPPR